MLFQNASKKNLHKVLSKNNNNAKNTNDSNKSLDTVKIEARKNKDIFSKSLKHFSVLNAFFAPKD